MLTSLENSVYPNHCNKGKDKDGGVHDEVSVRFCVCVVNHPAEGIECIPKAGRRGFASGDTNGEKDGSRGGKNVDEGVVIYDRTSHV